MSRLTATDLKALHSKSETEAPPEKPEFRRRNNQVRPATEKSIKFLRTLVDERTPDVDPQFVEDVIAQGQARVSKAIDNLLAKPKVSRTTVVTEQTTRYNRYKGTCEDCGATVLPNEGHLTRTDDGGWEIVHTTCPPSEFDFPFGRYAVETDEGHLAFYILDHSGLWVQASDEKHRIPTNALSAIAAKIGADPEAASLRYGRELKQCGRCGRTLTDETSRERGIGPTCAEKSWS